MKINALGKLGNRLLSSIIVSALVIVVFVTICTVGIRYFLDENIKGQKMLDSIEESNNRLFQSLIDQETGQRGYNLTGEAQFLEPYNEGAEKFTKSSEELINRTVKFPDLSQEVKQVINKGTYWQEHIGKRLVLQTHQGESPSVEILREGKDALDEFREASNHFSFHIEEQRGQVREKMQSRINSTLVSLMMSIIIIIMINVWINLQLLKSVIKPIIELSNSVKFYTYHEFSKGIPSYQRKDELYELIQNVDLMRIELSNSIRTLESKVNYDALTGLYNRRYFNEFIVKEWEIAKENEAHVSLILCDIDHYKKYNDTYGHLTGDECLQKISRILQSYNGDPMNFVARYGGEEFSIILLDQPEEKSVTIAEEIRKAIHDLQIPHKSSPTSKYVTISLGVATLIPSHGMEPSELIALADKALYESKQNGRNQVTEYKG